MDAQQASTKVTLENVRVGYVHVFETSRIGDGQPKYSVAVLLPKSDTANIARIQEAMNVAMEQGKQKKWGGRIPAILELPPKDGDVKDLVKNPEYAGCYIINCGNTTKPMVVSRSRQPITDPADFYSGCYANVIVNLFPWHNVGKSGISASLLGCQFVGDGERLAASVASVDDFAALEAAPAPAFGAQAPAFGAQAPAFGQQ